MSNLQGKTALVTGAASGIGLAVAERMAADGATVMIADLNAEAVKAKAEAHGFLYYAVDLSERAGCKLLVEAAEAKMGGVDILVNNAGFQHIDPIESFPEDTWDQLISVMLTAPFLLTRYCWPHMVKQGWGRVLNVSSVHGLVASPFKAGYISAKHGIIGLTKTTALEGGPHGITVNAICPGYVRTPLVEKQLEDQARTRGITVDEVVEKVMLDPAAVKRMVEPSEVAAMISFLTGPDAGLCTGTNWVMDGGWTAR